MTRYIKLNGNDVWPFRPPVSTLFEPFLSVGVGYYTLMKAREDGELIACDGNDVDAVAEFWLLLENEMIILRSRSKNGQIANTFKPFVRAVVLAAEGIHGAVHLTGYLATD